MDPNQNPDYIQKVDPNLASPQSDLGLSKTGFSGGKASIMIDPKYWTS